MAENGLEPVAMFSFPYCRSVKRQSKMSGFRRGLMVACACIFSACAALSSEVFAQHPVVINVDAANPPFMYGTTSHAEGLYPELIREAFQRMNQSVTIAAKPWKRVLSEIETGVAGVGGIYKTGERATKYDFSEPLFSESIVVYFHRNRRKEFRTLADLEGLRVGVLLGWSYGDEFDAAQKSGKIVTEGVASDRQNFDKLVQGRVDAVLAIEQVGEHFMSMPAFSAIDRSPVYLTENPTYLAFNKKQHAELLLTEFNRVLLDMHRDGSYKRVVDKTLGAK